MTVSTNGHRVVADEHYFAEHYGIVTAGDSDERQFAAAVKPLERRMRRRLNGPGRAACVQAFVQEPDRVKLHRRGPAAARLARLL
ncbi:MAG: hypothetical protein ACRDON_00385 [Gaiellaceae bacterium]